MSSKELGYCFNSLKMVESLFLLKLEPVPEPDPLSNTAQE